MPGFDRTGPNGQGARTGRNLGPCAKNVTEEDIDERRQTFFGRLRDNFGRREISRRPGMGRRPGRGRNRRFR